MLFVGTRIVLPSPKEGATAAAAVLPPAVYPSLGWWYPTVEDRNAEEF